ncbi:MAG: MaoC family dehydratase [Sphaerobacteraceae bacterium]|nr:MAG: MaoC family dehydratase [Sphaerobacteraceae bacterium]
MSQNISITTIQALKELEGREIGLSDWVEIDQARINQFAEATGDKQFIHIDADAAAGTFFGGTVAHGYLTLSLIPMLDRERSGIQIDLGERMIVNYGLNRVRFPSPVPSGSRVRLRTQLNSVEQVDETAIQLTQLQTIEAEGADKPACVAETITRLYFDNELTA